MRGATHQYERLAREVRRPAERGEGGEEDAAGAFGLVVAHGEHGVFEEFGEAFMAGAVADAAQFVADGGDGRDDLTDAAFLDAFHPVDDGVPMVVEDGHCDHRGQVWF